MRIVGYLPVLAIGSCDAEFGTQLRLNALPIRLTLRGRHGMLRQVFGKVNFGPFRAFEFIPLGLFAVVRAEMTSRPAGIACR